MADAGAVRQNIVLETIDEPASSLTVTTLVPVPDEDFGIVETASFDGGSRRAVRHDGWTSERIRTFLSVLSHCGVVSDAARAAGMSVKSAYRLRNRADGRAFHLAWDAALHLGRRRLADVAMSRAVNGWTETIRRDGKVFAERNRYDNRLTMAVLSRLDDKVRGLGEENSTAQIIAQEFDQFLDIVCAGGEGAADFVARRRQMLGYNQSFEAAVLDRAENYKQFGVGLTDEIDTSDLDPAAMANWTEEQAKRAALSGFLDTLTEDQQREYNARHGSGGERSA